MEIVRIEFSGGRRNPAAIGVAIADRRAAVLRSHPAVLAVVIAARRAFDPVAITVIIAGLRRGSDRARVPDARFVVIAIGVGAVAIAAADLIADHTAADGAKDGGKGLVTAAGDDIAEHAADADAGDGADNAVVAMRLAGLLGEPGRRGSGEQRGSKDEGAHGGFLKLFPAVWTHQPPISSSIISTS